MFEHSQPDGAHGHLKNGINYTLKITEGKPGAEDHPNNVKQNVRTISLRYHVMSLLFARRVKSITAATKTKDLGIELPGQERWRTLRTRGPCGNLCVFS